MGETRNCRRCKHPRRGDHGREVDAPIRGNAGELAAVWFCEGCWAELPNPVGRHWRGTASPVIDGHTPAAVKAKYEEWAAAIPDEGYSEKPEPELHEIAPSSIAIREKWATPPDTPHREPPPPQEDF